MTVRQIFNRVAWRVLNKVNDLFDAVEGVDDYEAEPQASSVSPEEVASWISSDDLKPMPLVDLAGENTAMVVEKPLSDNDKEVAELKNALEAGYEIKGGKPTDKSAQLVSGYNKSWIAAAMLHMFFDGKITAADVVKFDSTKDANHGAVNMAVHALNNGLADEIEAILLDRKNPTEEIFRRNAHRAALIGAGTTLAKLREAVAGKVAPLELQLDLEALTRRPRDQNKAAAQQRRGLDGYYGLDRTREALMAALVQRHNSTAAEGEDQLKHAQDKLEEMKLVADEMFEAQFHKIKMLQLVVESHRAAAERLAAEPVGENDKPEEVDTDDARGE